jgi:LysR family hydrogen peroxide-inducible transcriptional activator
LDINQVTYFLHLADTLNFTEAARRSGVSQPSLTRAIQRLEQELGGPLLYRDGRDTRLTALGRDIQVEFMRIDRNFQQVKELAENSVSGRRRVLNFGVTTTITANSFTDFFNIVLEQLPEVEIHLHPMERGEDSAQVLSGKYDACILPSHPPGNIKLAVQPLFDERLMVACSSDHPFASQNIVQAEQLSHEVYVDRLACEFHTQLVDYFMDRDILMRPRFSSEREDWVQQMVFGNSAICILPDRSGLIPGLVIRPIEGLDLSRNVSLVTISGSGSPIELRQIVKMAATYDWSARSPDV